MLDKQVVRAMLKASQLPAELVHRLGPDSFFACLAAAPSTGHLDIANATPLDLALLLQLRAAGLIRGLASAADAVGEDVAIERDPGVEARLSKAATEAFVGRIIARECSSPKIPGGDIVLELLTMVSSPVHSIKHGSAKLTFVSPAVPHGHPRVWAS